MFLSLVVFRADGASAVLVALAVLVSGALVVLVVLVALAVRVVGTLAVAVASKMKSEGILTAKGQLSEKSLTTQEPKVQESFC